MSLLIFECCFFFFFSFEVVSTGSSSVWGTLQLWNVLLSFPLCLAGQTLIEGRAEASALCSILSLVLGHSATAVWRNVSVFLACSYSAPHPCAAITTDEKLQCLTIWQRFLLLFFFLIIYRSTETQTYEKVQLKIDGFLPPRRVKG